MPCSPSWSAGDACHTYLDYSISNLLAAVLIALTFGQLGDAQPNFFTQLRQVQDNWHSVLFAIGGGAALSIGNVCTQYGWAYAGTTLNYFLDNKINRATILFPGVACFFVAAVLGAALHGSNKADIKRKLRASPNSTNEVWHQAESATQVLESNKFTGIAIVFFAGFLMSLFSPAFNLATNDQWHFLKDGVPHLVVYTAFFYFSISSFVIGVGFNIWFLYHPIASVEVSSFTAYLKDWKGRHWALLAGLLCGFDNGLEFMGGQAADYAAADAVEALPLVSTFWAILLLKEYWRSSKKTYILLVSMMFTFVAAVALLMASAGQRSTK
uniref:Ureide permease 2 n=1 Tax=Brachypodium distachyon TaxID=15368 RepID=C3SA39_BRADI|nr:ureide permease 2 [Brachypodium distachyon]